MAGTPGNPNHDPKTGKFASASGLNRSNSTIGQRGKARVKEAGSAAKAYVASAAGLAVAGIGMAALRGVQGPVLKHTNRLTNAGLTAGIAHVEKLVALHGPSIGGVVKNAIPFIAHHSPNIGKALKGGGSTLVNHVKNMKSAGAIQHSSRAGSASSDYAIRPRPRIRHKGA